jgi:hypothetical protein
MAYRKRYRTVFPVPVDEPVDDAVTVWLTRESFDRTAASEALQIVEFTDAGTVAPEDIPPKVEKQLGRPATDFVWRAFEGVGERGPADA